MSAIPEEIILRSFQKTITPEETETLNKWLKEDKKNVGYYFQLEEIWYSNKKLSAETISSGWNRLFDEIENHPQPIQLIPGSRKQKTLSWLRYAAAALIGAMITSTIIWQVQKASDPEDLLVQNVIYNRTGIQAIVFPDSSQAWINDLGKISYPDRFDQQERIVQLEGKAYFDVKKDNGKPFIIRTENIEVEVTGTELFIDFSSEEHSTVTLISGKVNVHAYNKQGKSTTSPLLPGQQADINKLTGEISVTDTDTDYYVAWKDGIYRFTDVPLEKIAGLISRYYNVEIQIDPALRKKRFTGRITYENDITDVMNIISKSLPVRYEITGRKIKIKN